MRWFDFFKDEIIDLSAEEISSKSNEQLLTLLKTPYISRATGNMIVTELLERIIKTDKK